MLLPVIRRASSEARKTSGNYVRTAVVVSPAAHAIPLREIVLFDGVLPGAKLSGPEKGPVVVAGDMFVGLEHPIAHATITGDVVRCGVDRAVDLAVGQSADASAVFGTVRPGQLRRDFQAYVERERAHPYRPFLHYNTWYDLGYFNRYTQVDLIATIAKFGNELTAKRGVVLSSFMLDDGWDNPTTLWDFNPSFTNGLVAVRDAVAKYHTAPGIWMSPWGGYGKPHRQRLAAATQQGYEANKDGPILSGPKYYDHFRDVCLNLIKTADVNQFKFDGTGNANGWSSPAAPSTATSPPPSSLIGELRARSNPTSIVNLTTGTYPSALLVLMTADSASGVAAKTTELRRRRHHTGRALDHLPRRRHLRPRSSKRRPALPAELPHAPRPDLRRARTKTSRTGPQRTTSRNEIRSYFGTGTQLQEMYITPDLAPDRRNDWDVTSPEAAIWSPAPTPAGPPSTPTGSAVTPPSWPSMAGPRGPPARAS